MIIIINIKLGIVQYSFHIIQELSILLATQCASAMLTSSFAHPCNPPKAFVYSYMAEILKHQHCTLFGIHHIISRLKKWLNICKQLLCFFICIPFISVLYCLSLLYTEYLCGLDWRNEIILINLHYPFYLLRKIKFRKFFIVMI